MENYQMNRSYGRPYNRTCGMSKPCPQKEISGRSCPYYNNNTPSTDCNCVMPGTKSSDKEMYSHLQHLEPAMAYVPCQEFTETFNLPYALSVGTIFPQLCKPFCGKRGSAR